MSAVVDTTLDTRVAQVIADHDGDTDRALLACLLEIDRLGAALITAAHQSSYGYNRGRLRSRAGVPAGTVNPTHEPLDV